jgi:lipid II:glycine glycyltransferase (peptidoglycan interpeptide bridge formation enzyme)
VRQTINKAIKLGVTVRRGEGAADLRAFHRLYARNRRRHGIPPQPMSLFSSLLAHLRGTPEATLYLAEHDGRPLAGLIVVRFSGVTYAKYEGVDEERRDLLPVYPLLWQAIADACAAGDRAFDFGRTATDNPGLMAFKSRWGTEPIEMPYYFSPPSEGLSTVPASSGVCRPRSVCGWERASSATSADPTRRVVKSHGPAAQGAPGPRILPLYPRSGRSGSTATAYL